MKRLRPENHLPMELRFCRFKGGGGDAPAVTKPVPTAPISPPAKETSEDVKNVKADEKQREKQRQGYQSTIISGASGLGTAPETGKKTLLGG